MSSLIEIKAANEFTIHYSTEDTLGPHRVQRTKNVMLITQGESLDLRNHESSKSFSKLKISCNGSNTRNDLSYFMRFFLSYQLYLLSLKYLITVCLKKMIQYSRNTLNMKENSDVDRIFLELYTQSEDQTSDRASSIESRFSDFNETVDSFSPSTPAVSNTVGESKTSVSSLVAAFSLMQQESSSDFSLALPSLNAGKDVHTDSVKSETLKHSASDSFETEYNKTHVTVFEKPNDVTSNQSAHDEKDDEKDPLKASEDLNTSVNEDSDFVKTDENNNSESNIPDSKSDLSNTNEPSTNEASTQAGLKPKRKTRSNSTQSSGKGYGALNRSISLDATVQTQRSPEEQKIYELKEEFRQRGEKIKQNSEKSESEVKKKKIRKDRQRKKTDQTSEENFSAKTGKDERRKKGLNCLLAYFFYPSFFSKIFINFFFIILGKYFALQV